MRQQLLPIALPPAFDIPMLTLETAQALSDEGEVYFRVAAAEANLLEETSVEDAHGTPEAIALRFGKDSVEALQADLENHEVLFWNDEGHLGAGIYYRGVCCCDELAGLADYAFSRHWAKPGDVVWIFKGEYTGSCNDGDVVIPTEVVGILSLSDFVKSYVVDRRANDASIHVLGIETALGIY